VVPGRVVIVEKLFFVPVSGARQELLFFWIITNSDFG